MTTQTKDLLHAIWTGDVTPVPSSQTHALFDLVGALCNAQLVLIEVPSGPLCGRVFHETAELLPDLPVADVLEEELDMCVPKGGTVVCLSQDVLGAGCDPKALSTALGAVAAQIIVDAVQMSAAPVMDERGEMRKQADILMSVVRSIALSHASIDAAVFKNALARGFAFALEGAMAAHLTDATLTERFVPEMGGAVSFASPRDAGFWTCAGLATPANTAAPAPASTLPLTTHGRAPSANNAPSAARKV